MNVLCKTHKTSQIVRKDSLNMRNIALTLQYHGTSYHGWQRQKNAMTVQQTVEEAIFAVTGENSTVHGCGRTDAGVHALEYVCNFRSPAKLPIERVPHALNAQLPDDICCLSAYDAEPEFHARFSATGKKYVYKILNRDTRDVFLKDLAWQIKYPLDIDIIRQACVPFVGTHDFAAFCAVGGTVKETTRTIYSLDASRQGDVISIEVEGNGFLYNMVRIVVGTLVYAANGKIDVNDIADIISGKNRCVAGITAPPHGLYMAKAMYGTTAAMKNKP